MRASTLYIHSKKQWYQLPELIPSNSDSGLHSCISISIHTQNITYVAELIHYLQISTGTNIHTCMTCTNYRIWATSTNKTENCCPTQKPQIVSNVLTILILLSVHSWASSLARRVTSSDASAIAFAQSMRSLLEPPSPLHANTHASVLADNITLSLR